MSASWFKCLARISSGTSFRTARRTQRLPQRARTRICLEALEDRELLSAPGTEVVPYEVLNFGQFGQGNPGVDFEASIPLFDVHKSFSTGPGVHPAHFLGAYLGDYGYEAKIDPKRVE